MISRSVPTLSYHACLGSLRYLSETVGVQEAAKIPIGNITGADWRDLTTNLMWQGVQRPRLTHVLDMLTQGVLQLQGLPSLQLSAEHYAAVIYMVVQKCNWQICCQWLEREETMPSHEDIVIDNLGPDTKRITASQLFALLMELSDDTAAQTFRKKWLTETQTALGLAPKSGSKESIK